MAGATSMILNGVRAALLGGEYWQGFNWGDNTTWNDSASDSPYKERILIGSKNLPSNLGPPCIVLIPESGENFTGPEGPGQNPQTPVVASKSVVFSAHCWGAPHPTIRNDLYTQAEELADAVLSALRLLVGAGNARMVGENWPQAGHDVAGVVLVRTYRADGVGIQEIKLPLDRPIIPNASQMVQVIGPDGQTAPGASAGILDADTSMGVKTL